MDKVKVFEKEIEYIKNLNLIEPFKRMIELLPDYFFEIPASSTGKYHPSYALGTGGLVRHTKVAVRIAKELLDNNSLGHKFTDDEKDLLIISIMIHDGLKHGIEKSEYTVFDHPLQISKFIKENCLKYIFFCKNYTNIYK